MGRLVLTHSTFIDGFLSWAKKVSKNSQIKTVTPGIIGRTSSNSNKFCVKVSRKISTGYKLIARKGKSFQEVYVVTNLSEEKFEDLINNI